MLFIKELRIFLLRSLVMLSKLIYDEAILGEPVSGATQVQQMLDSITHEPTK